MHGSVMQWVAQQVERHGLAGRSVLEVGALDVNGSVRSLFVSDYLGVDMRDGPGVDLVCNAHDLGSLLSETDFGHFDVIVSTEMLEHDSAPWVSLAQMRQVSHDDSWLLLTARGYDERGCFELHGYPEDHWRFSVTGMEHLLEQTGWEPLEVIPDPEAPGVFALARADG